MERCCICLDDCTNIYSHKDKTCCCIYNCCDDCERLIKKSYICLICRSKTNSIVNILSINDIVNSLEEIDPRLRYGVFHPLYIIFGY